MVKWKKWVLLCLGSVLLCTAFPKVALAEAKPMTLLLLGIDTGELGRTEHGRSDVMMVAVVNPTTQKLTLVSLPRDTYTEMVGMGTQDKLNHAYAFGGLEMAKESVAHLLGTTIDHTLAVDMKGIENLVELVNGIEVISPETFEIEGYKFTKDQAVQLDGKAALHYVRERYNSGGDYARQERQRQVMLALITKLQQTEQLNPVAALTLLQQVKSDIALPQLFTMYQDYAKVAYTTTIDQLSGSGTMMDGVYYDITDPNSLGKIQTLIANTLENL